MHFDTAPNIINDALLELGLVDTAVSNVYSSSDANVIGMRALLKALGRRLVREYTWSALQRVATITTAVATESYALPSDFGSLIPSTQWNMETDQRLLGPLQSQGWRVLQSTTSVVGITYWHRLYGNAIHLYPVPTAEEGITYEYQSRFWVVPTGQTIPTSETPSANTDTIWLDSRLMVSGLKLAWRRFKRMDAAAEEEEYASALAVAMGGDTFSPDLSLTGGGGGVRLLDVNNIPETGYGS